MKHLFFTLVALAFLVGCSSPNKAKPIIKEYLMEQISNPDTYKAGAIEIVDKGTIDVADTKYWKHIPESGKIDVVILRHEFTHDNRSDILTNNAYYFYMSPSLDVVYYAHFDGGEGPLFSLN